MATATKEKKPANKKPANKKAAPKAQPATVEPTAFMVKLGDLTLSKDNVRKSHSEASINQLAKSLAAVGQIQDLRVRPTGKGTFEVVAGGRRYRAFKALEKDEGKIKGQPVTAEFLVRVSEQAADANDKEISLHENFQREDMEAADEIAAFAALSEQGKTPEEIADRFGISHMTVRRRLKLANLSPRIIQELREGNISYDQMGALALSDSHEEQESAWFEAAEYMRTPHNLRHQLTQERYKASHRVVQFVGLDAYKQAGGTVTADLFAGEDSTLLDDRNLLEKLAMEKLEDLAEPYRLINAWGWVECSVYNSSHEFGRIYPSRQKPDEAAEAEIEKLNAEILANHELLHEAETAGNSDSEEEVALFEKIDLLELQVIEIEQRFTTWDKIEQSFAGVMVTIDSDGKAKVVEGLITEQDRTAMNKAKEEAAKSDHVRINEDGEIIEDGETVEEVQTAQLSAALVDDLSKLKTQALRVEVANNQLVALQSLAYSLVLKVMFGNSYRRVDSASGINTFKASTEIDTIDADNTAAIDKHDLLYSDWAEIIPEDETKLWDWITKQDMDSLTKLLAFLSAMTINPVGVVTTGGAASHFNQLCEAVALDMGKYWKPSTGFFQRTNKATTIAICREAEQPDEFCNGLAKLKKAKLVEEVWKQLKASKWLPAPLRAKA